ncbi:embryonic polarity protein dorsal isoform X2 [Teleopsis dalmanni]|nr:embryonic polarity protein dorsal isoform X2 [Teleopsis dalmanni]
MNAVLTSLMNASSPSSPTNMQSPVFTQGSQQNLQNKSAPKPFINIVEQPATKALRFRYKCEGRSAGSIPGLNSTPENKTYPTIEIVGYKGDVVIVVSCVTKDPPYRQHPHYLVGKDGCKDGICTLVLSGEPLRAVFSNLGIQCVKKNDIKAALEVRERLQVDPFKTKFGHKDQPASIDLNVVRLCFQAFLKTESGVKPLQPVVSEPVFDKKAMSDLVICRLCCCSAKVGGGDEIILLCEKIAKDDIKIIKIRFYELSNDNQLVWEDFAEFLPTDIHKQTAIAFKTPRYHNQDVLEKAKVFIQLVRPSDGVQSESIPFEYHPDPGMRTFTRLRRKLKRKEDLEIFQQILSMDSETTATKYSCPPTDPDADNEFNDTVSTDSSASKPNSSDTLNEYDEAVKRHTESETDGGNESEKIRGMEIELEVPQISYPAADESTQTSTPMEDILKSQQLDTPRQLSTVDKITNWMRSSEFERTDSLTVENGDTISLSPVTVYTNVTTFSANNHTTISTATDEDKTFNELMEQVAEYDDMFADSISRRGTLDNPIIKELPIGGVAVNEDEIPTVIEGFAGTASAQASIELDENFDETATYTSLQIAFKNPVEIPIATKKEYATVPNTGAIVNEDDGLVVLTNPPAPRIKVNSAQTPPSPLSPPLPPRTPSPVPDQKLPPLPPKRKTSQELSGTERPPPNDANMRTRNGSITSRPLSQIIIMRTPDQSPTKRQTTPTASPKKKQGFFSRLFSRRKSKNETSSIDETNSKSGGSKATSPSGSREPSIGHFSLNDPNRTSIRSGISIPNNSPGLSPQNSTNANKGSKPVGRSVSSVSGKRPAHLNADVIHIPLKGDSASSLPQQEAYSNASTITFGHQLDRKTISALQLADIPINDGNIELVAIADRQSIKNLCEGAYGVVLDPDVDLSEAEHFALYTSVPPVPSNASDCIDHLNYQEQIESGQLLSVNEIARRLAEANGLQ